MLVRIREATQRCSQKLQLTLEKETGEAAMEEAAHMEELAAYDTQAHVLEVQATLEEQAQFNSTQQLIAAADKYFQESLASAQLRTKEFKAMSIRETEETKQEVEALKRTLDQVCRDQQNSLNGASEQNGLFLICMQQALLRSLVAKAVDLK